MAALMADGLGRRLRRRDCVAALDLELRRAGRTTPPPLAELHDQYPRG